MHHGPSHPPRPTLPPTNVRPTSHECPAHALHSITGFVAYSHHVPDDGNILVLFAPHVGVTAAGELGKVLRPGQGRESTSCGACIGAYNALAANPDFCPHPQYDSQMHEVVNRIMRHMSKIVAAADPMQAIPGVLYQAIKDHIEHIVAAAGVKFRVALLGGIQINAPHIPNVIDAFEPRSFELIHPAGGPKENLLPELLQAPPWAMGP